MIPYGKMQINRSGPINEQLSQFALNKYITPETATGAPMSIERTEMVS